MERESYSDPEIAGIMNANFVSVKVDREERPDVDNIYMTFVEATTGNGGWPMSSPDSSDGKHALEMTLFTLRKMAEGGIHDHLGGGFHRYSVDSA